MNDVITVVIYAGIVQGVYMAFLLSRNKKRNPANNYLAVLLITLSVSIAHSVFVIPAIQNSVNSFFPVREPFLMLVIPLIWLYVKKMDQPLFRFRAKLCLHFLPFIVFMAVNIPVFFQGPGSVMAQFLDTYSRLFNGTIWAVLLVQYSSYLFRIVKITHNYRFKAEQEFSDMEQLDISWLNFFLYSFILVFVILFVMFAGALHHFDTAWMSRLVCLVFSIAIFVLGYKGLIQKSIFSNTEDLKQVQSAQLKSKTAGRELSSFVLRYMEEQKPYREPELTLTSLAKQVKISRNQLSELINNDIGSNFYDFVNKYRVDEVKLLMNDPKCKDFTILAIAYDAGFPSKSTFNSVFKKFTGLTPSAYRAGLS